MVSVAGTQHRHAPTAPATQPQGGEGAGSPSSPGKSAQSVGHLAKAMVAESGDTAHNAIGKAAATIAKMTFEQRAALLQPPAPEPAPTTDPTDDGTETPPVDTTETPPVDTTETPPV